MLRDYWAKCMRWLYRVWRDPVGRAALLMAVLALGCLTLMRLPPKFSSASKPQNFPGNSGLEVQFLRDTEDLRLTLGDYPSVDRQTMREKLQIDFAFILAYSGLFVSLSFLMARAGGWKRIAAIFGALCGVGAGIFDMVENLASLRILDVPIRLTTQAMLDAIHTPALIKWSLSGAAIVLLLTQFIPRPKTS